MCRDARSVSRPIFCLLLAIPVVASISCASHAEPQSARAEPSMLELARENVRYADPTSPPGKDVLTANDEAFLEDLEKRGVLFFVEQADPVTGLIPDRAHADGSESEKVCSVAAVGFGLSAYVIGAERGYITRDDAYARCLKVLRFLRDHGEHAHGHFYHFLKMRTGQREWKSEASTVDTALLLAGALSAREYFPDTELAKVVTEIYDRVDWPWMVTADGTLSMGWTPEAGFIKATWNHYSESPLVYLMAIGSNTHALPATSWHVWERTPVFKYEGLTFIQYPPLFIHQFPQCWFDLRGLRDDYADYFENSQLATIAQRDWSMRELSKRFPTYGPTMWGLTASDSANGYDAFGGPPEQGRIDGTIAPCAPAGSLAFQPRLCIDALKAMKAYLGDRGYVRYGFVDAFNPATGWVNKDVIGIDVGPSVIMAENCRTGLIWRLFMRCPEVKRAMSTAGFRQQSQAELNTPTTSLFKVDPGVQGIR